MKPDRRLPRQEQVILVNSTNIEGSDISLSILGKSANVLLARCSKTKGELVIAKRDLSI